MREIVTVTGTISPSELGFTQFHEHLLLSKGKSFEINANLYMDDVASSKKDVLDYKNAGGRTIIDAQPGGCNRMAAGLAEIARATGVNIICSTGFHKLTFYPEDHWIHREPESAIRDFYIRELTEGVDPDCDKNWSGIISKEKAGIIKCALDKENLSPPYQRLFRAAAQAAISSNRTLMVHIESGSDPLTLLDFLKAEGADPEHIVFCHLDRAIADLDVHRRLLHQGIYLEDDTVGRFKYHSDDREIQIMQELIDDGYEDQLLFSLDTTRERLRSYNPEGVGLDYILNRFMPHMLADGITVDQMRKMSIENPKRVLT